MRGCDGKLTGGIVYSINFLEACMKSFKEYEAKDTEKGQTANAEDLAKQIAKAYNGKTNADMLKNILAEAEKSKRAGTLSNEEIESFYQSFAPMLGRIQRKRLRAIVDRLKEIWRYHVCVELIHIDFLERENQLVNFFFAVVMGERRAG